MTDRQQAILDFIRSFMGIHQRPPTVREIAGAFEINVNAVSHQLESLAVQDEIAYGGNVSRGIRVLKGPCPFCGSERKHA